MKTKITILIFALIRLTSFAQWLPTNGPNGAGPTNSLAIKDNYIFAGTNSGGVFVSNDKGNIWTAKNNGIDNPGIVSSIVVSGKDVFAGVNAFGSSNTVFLTIDNGEIWTPKGLPTLLFTLAAKPSYLIAGTWFGCSYSTDNGLNWKGSISGLPSNAAVSDLAFEGSKIFCGVTASSVGGTGVFRSINNGTSWTSFNTSLANTIVSRLAVIGTNLFAGTATAGVFISNTATAAWTPANNGLSNSSIKSLWVHGTHLFAATNNGIFLSSNNGANWINVSAGLPANTIVYSITSDATDIYIGTGTNVWRRPLAELGITAVDETFLENAIVDIYPNPFNISTTIKFTKELNNAELTIFNLYGQKLKTIERISGQEIEFYRDDLSLGIYFIKLSQNNKAILTNKLMIVD